MSSAEVAATSSSSSSSSGVEEATTPTIPSSSKRQGSTNPPQQAGRRMADVLSAAQSMKTSTTTANSKGSSSKKSPVSTTNPKEVAQHNNATTTTDASGGGKEEHSTPPPLYQQQQKLYERCKDYPMGTPQQMLNPGLMGASIMGSKGRLHILAGVEVEEAKSLFPEEIRESLDELGPQKSIYLLSMFKQYESMRVSTGLAAAIAENKTNGSTLTDEEVKRNMSTQLAKEFSSKIQRELDLTKQLHDRFSKIDEENRRARFIALIIVAIIVITTGGIVYWLTAEPDRTRQAVMWTNYYLNSLKTRFGGGGGGGMGGGSIPTYPNPQGFVKPTDDTPVMAMQGGQPFGIYDE